MLSKCSLGPTQDVSKVTSQPRISWPFHCLQGRSLQICPWKPSPAVGPPAEGLGSHRAVVQSALVRTLAGLDAVGSREEGVKEGLSGGRQGSRGKVMGKVTAPRGKGGAMTPGHTPWRGFLFWKEIRVPKQGGGGFRSGIPPSGHIVTAS